MDGGLDETVVRHEFRLMRGGGLWPQSLRKQGRRDVEAVIASVSEAIHFLHLKKKEAGLLRRFAPLHKRFAFVAGNDDQIQFRILAARCARGLPLNSRPLRNEGAGNAGRPMRPAVSCAKCNKKTHTSIQVTPESPGIPRAMVYGLSRALPGDRACLPPSSAEYCIRQLDSSVGEPGPHDFARPLWRASSKSASASTAARPALLTLRNAPLWDGMVKDIGLFIISEKQNIFI
jgi:hypothetical protein